MTPPKPPQITGKRGRKPNITSRLAEAIELMLSGECKTQKEAAERLGMDRPYLCKALQKPHVVEYIRRRIEQRMRSIGAIKASATLERLAHAAESEYVQESASRHVLAIAGVRAKGDGQTGGGGGVTVKVVLHHHDPASLVPPTIDVTPTRAPNVHSDD